ncbi:MAG: hypothetical protein IJ310_04475 [Clostridia bacterium]|nr:hypothetical protein [Clostridiales bacterium]MBQ7918046.1 hypothetical protein [Clostridia bacterium]
MIKIVAISIITVFLSSIVKQKNSEFATIINVCGGVLIFMSVYEMFEEIMNFFIASSDELLIDSSIIKLAIKIIGVGYITEFTADIAEDFGNKNVSSKVVFGGKVIVCGMTLPIIKKLFSLLFSFC